MAHPMLATWAEVRTMLLAAIGLLFAAVIAGLLGFGAPPLGLSPFRIAYFVLLAMAGVAVLIDGWAERIVRRRMGR
jgi:hypothetical protein